MGETAAKDPLCLLTLVVLLTGWTSAEIAIMHYGHFGGLSITCNRDELILMESELLGFSTNSDCNPQPLCSVPYTLAKWYCRGKSTCAGMQVERRPLHKRTCGNDFTNCLRVEYKCVSMRRLTDVCSETIYEASSGYISSPNFPEMYPHDKNCTCSLTASPGDHVKVYSAFFLLKSNTPCNDWVSMTVDSEASTKCGYIPEQKVHVGRKVNLNFRSDQTDTEMGFWFKFSGSNGSPVTIRCGRYAFMDSKVSPKRVTPTTPELTTTTPVTTTMPLTTTEFPTTTKFMTTSTEIPYLREEAKSHQNNNEQFPNSYDETGYKDNANGNLTSASYRNPKYLNNEEFVKLWEGTSPSLQKPLDIFKTTHESNLEVLQHDSKQGIPFKTTSPEQNEKPQKIHNDFQNAELQEENSRQVHAEPTILPENTRQPRSTAEPAKHTYGNIQEDILYNSDGGQFKKLKIDGLNGKLQVNMAPTAIPDVTENTIHHVHQMTTRKIEKNIIHPKINLMENPKLQTDNIDDKILQRENSEDQNSRQAPSIESEDTLQILEPSSDNTKHGIFIAKTPDKKQKDEAKVITAIRNTEDYNNYNYDGTRNEYVLGDYNNYGDQNNRYENPLQPTDIKTNTLYQDVIKKANEIKESLKHIQNKDTQVNTINGFPGGAREGERQESFISESYSNEISNKFASNEISTKSDDPTSRIINANDKSFDLPESIETRNRHSNHYTNSPMESTIHDLPKQEPLTARRPNVLTFEQSYQTLPRNSQSVEIDYEQDIDSEPGESLFSIEKNMERELQKSITEKPAIRSYQQITPPPLTTVTPDYNIQDHVHSEPPWNKNLLATGEFKPAINHLALVDQTTSTATTTNRPFRTAEVITLQGSVDENGLLLGENGIYKDPSHRGNLKEGVEFSNSELYGVIQTKILMPKHQVPTKPSILGDSNQQSIKTTKSPKIHSTSTTSHVKSINLTVSSTHRATEPTEFNTESEGPWSSLSSTAEIQPASKSTQNKTGTVWILVVIAVIGWVIFMAFLGILLYYRRDRLLCRRSFQRMQNSPQTSKSPIPKHMVLPAFGGNMPFGLKGPAPNINASTQTRKKHAVSLFSSDGESSRSSTSLGSHLLSPSVTCTPTLSHSHLAKHRPLPPLPYTSRPAPPPPPSTPGGRSLGIQTIANSNICTQTEQSNCSQTDLTLMFNPFESISKAINRRNSYRDVENLSKDTGRKSSFRDFSSQPQTPLRERYPPGQYTELPKKKQFATINASGLSALNNLNNSNISSWALHRIPSICKEKRPRILPRRSSSKQSKVSSRSISPQVSFSLPGDMNHEGEIIDLSNPAYKRARSSSRTTSRTSSSCSTFANPYASTIDLIQGTKATHSQTPKTQSKLFNGNGSAHTPYPVRARDPSPLSSNTSEPRSPINWISNSHLPPTPVHQFQTSKIHHGRIHKLQSPPLKPGPFRPPPPSPTKPQSPTEKSSIRSNDFPPPPPEIMLTDPPSNHSPQKKRLPIPYQQISTDFTLKKAIPTANQQNNTKSNEESCKTTYAFPVKQTSSKVQVKSASTSPDGKNTADINGKQAADFIDFYFSGDSSTALVFSNDGRSSTSSRSSAAPELPPKHFTPMSSMRRAPPTPPPPPDVGTLTRNHSGKAKTREPKNQTESDPAETTDMDLKRIGPPLSQGERPTPSKDNGSTNTGGQRKRDTSTERVRKLVPQQAYMFHDMVQPELQAILDKRRSKSEPVEV